MLEGEAMSELDIVERAYGCAFCYTGREQAAAQHIERICDNTRAIVAQQVKVRTIKKETFTETKVLYPGYVFFEAPVHEKSFLRIHKEENVISILKSEKGEWQLYGNDAKLVQWLFSYGGLISFSQAYQEGDRIKIISGPLKDMEHNIIRVDKRLKGAQVLMTFCGREIPTWLRYELVEKIE